MKKKKIKNAFFEISYFSLYVIMKNTTTGDLLIFLYQCIKIKSSLLIYKTSSSWTDSLAFPIMDDIASRKDIDMTQTHMMRGIACTVAGAVTWGLNGTCSQYVFMHYSITSLYLTMLRLLGSGIILVSLVVFMDRHRLFALLQDTNDFLRIAVFGLFGISACSLSYLSAIQYANAGTATVLQSLNVVFMSIYGAILLRQTLSRWQSIAIVLAVLGGFFIATGGRLDAMVLSPYGLFWGIGAAVASCVYTVLPQRAIAKWGTLAVNGLGMLIAGLVMSAFIVPAYDTPTLDMVGIMAVLFIIIVGTVFSFTIFLRGVGDIGPVKATFIGTLEPLSATVASFVFLGTPFTDTDLFGFLCIITTVYMITMKQGRRNLEKKS